MFSKTSIASAASAAPPVILTSSPPPGSETVSRQNCTGSSSVAASPSPRTYAKTSAAFPSSEHTGPTNGA